MLPTSSLNDKSKISDAEIELEDEKVRGESAEAFRKNTADSADERRICIDAGGGGAWETSRRNSTHRL
jgi:hypothetical protein